ncbi:MAG: hypothetical protein KAG97_09615, partial [Victivallales bacterium]|nr:hypothetical protein [Victivallales bacterium]
MKFAADSNDTNQSHIHEHCDSAANARTPPADSSDSTHVFISGTGVVCAAGRDLEESFATMLSGTRNPTDRPTLFESELNKPVFECPSDLELDDDLRSERTLALAAKALDEALNNANLAASELAGPRVGVVLGSTVACMLNSVDFYAEVRKGGMPDMAPLTKYVNGDISERIADMLSATGPRATIANACSSGANAVMTAFSWIRAGLCDIVIAGGADELSLIPYCGFNSLQIMGDAPCTPFDRGRKGLTLGEGAGILILETVASLERRGRDPKARLITCGCASDAYHLTGPHPEGRGLKRAVAQALKSAAVDAGRIDYVNAHGTATPDNDRVEANALFDIFGKRLRYSSTKYYT